MPGDRQPSGQFVRYRLSRASRLRTASDFQAVKVGGKSWTGRYFILAILRSGDPTPVRLGIVTTRRVGGAVLRNRLRRLVREIFRRHQHRIERGIRLVTIVRRSATAIALPELERDWLRLAERASILAAA
jgi:ribonuclease P protein component